MKLSFYYKLNRILREGISNNSGFSLIEILVATAVSSVILLMIYSAHRSITFAILELTGVADFYEGINLAINRIDRDISCAYFHRNNKKLCFIGESDYDSPGEGKLNFVTIDHKEFSMFISPKEECRISDVREIGYYLEADNEIDGLFFLIRREENHYDDDPESGGDKSILLENVVRIKFEFNQRNKWIENWDSRDNKRFPKAVRTTLNVRNYRGNEEEFIFVSNINLKR
ncbi:MAG: type II secretion system protein GspJ [Spirochaetota bacterium]|nr:type II secretion system protein GspJ [Spirochaetota bacterium]